MHFGDYIFIVLLALVLFGPKRLPEIARQAGRLMMEFRRASNEFKMQMDEELRALEEEDRRKKLEEAAAQTGSIGEPHALPSATTQAETLTNAEAEEPHPPEDFAPPLPDEECVDPVDLLDAPQSHAEDLYAEESRAEEDRYSAYRAYDELESEEYGPEISAEYNESSYAASYQPSDEPSAPVQPDGTTHEKPMNSQDPVRPESDPAIHHA